MKDLPPKDSMPYQNSATNQGPSISIPEHKGDLQTTTQGTRNRFCSPASTWTASHTLVLGCRMCLAGGDRQDFQEGCGFRSGPSRFEDVCSQTQHMYLYSHRKSLSFFRHTGNLITKFWSPEITEELTVLITSKLQYAFQKERMRRERRRFGGEKLRLRRSLSQ